MKDIQAKSGEHCSLVIYAGMLLSSLPLDHPLRPTLEMAEQARTKEEIAAALRRVAEAASAPGLMTKVSQANRDLINGLLSLCPQTVRAA